MMRASSASGFCVGCSFSPFVVLQPLRAGADRKQPVGAHLHVVIGGLQRFVVEGVALALGVAASPRSASHGRSGSGGRENSASGWSCARRRR